MPLASPGGFLGVYHSEFSGNSCLATLQIFCSLPWINPTRPPLVWAVLLIVPPYPLLFLLLHSACQTLTQEHSHRLDIFCLVLIWHLSNISCGLLEHIHSGCLFPLEDCPLDDILLMNMKIYFLLYEVTQLLCPDALLYCTHIVSLTGWQNFSPNDYLEYLCNVTHVFYLWF